MKAQYIRDDQEVSPAFYDKLPKYIEQGLVEYRDVMRNGLTQPVPFFKNGAVLEEPNAHWLVRFGVAIPADESCAIRARMTPEMMAKEQRWQELIARHIEPEDADLFDAGVIEGVDVVTGDFIPGMNWSQLADFRPLGESEEDSEEDDI